MKRLADGTRAVRTDSATTWMMQSPPARKQAYFDALDAGVQVVQNEDDAGRTKITDALYRCTTLSGQRREKNQRCTAASYFPFRAKMAGAHKQFYPEPVRP